MHQVFQMKIQYKPPTRIKYFNMPGLKKSFLLFSLVFVLSLISFITSDIGKSMLRKLVRISTFAGVLRKNGAKVDIDKVRTPPMYPPRHSERVTLCHSKFKDKNKLLRQSQKNDKQIPTIYFITPTYPRSEQIAELTRLAQTLLHIPNLHWVIAEDSRYCSKMIYSLLEHWNIPYTHLSSPMPDIYRTLAMKDRPRGVSSRRAGLHWVLNHNQNMLNNTVNTPISAAVEAKITSTSHSPSVIYFGDDDNT